MGMPNLVDRLYTSSRRGGPCGDPDRHKSQPTIPHHQQRDGLARRHVRQGTPELVHAFEALLVDGHDQITGPGCLRCSLARWIRAPAGGPRRREAAGATRPRAPETQAEAIVPVGCRGDGRGESRAWLFGQGDPDRVRPAAAPELEAAARAWRPPGDPLKQVGEVREGRPVDGRHDVTGCKPGAPGRAVQFHLDDQCTGGPRKAERFRPARGSPPGTPRQPRAAHRPERAARAAGIDRDVGSG